MLFRLVGDLGDVGRCAGDVAEPAGATPRAEPGEEIEAALVRCRQHSSGCPVENAIECD